MTGTQAQGLGRQVVDSLIWRTGSQIFAQIVAWTSTFLVIRMLDPTAYGLYAMTDSMIMLLATFSGISFANALVRQETVTHDEIRKVFGLLIILNAGLAAIQFASASLVATYYHQPMVAHLLRVQTLLYVATPVISLATALLSREMDFRKQALAHLVSALAGAGTALAGALSGIGVWALVAAPIAMVWTRAIVLAITARNIPMPSFRFSGLGHAISFGLTITTSYIFWFLQTQADVFIGGRSLDPHRLGIYTTSLFLAQMLTAKFVPPINDIAFSAYARMGSDRDAVSRGFTHAVRLIMTLVMPFYIGMAMTAGPLVYIILGPQWHETAVVVTSLALVMPCMTLQIMCSPVTNAAGKPRLTAYSSMAGAVIMPLAFLYGVHEGPIGLARAWWIGFPLLTAFTLWISLPVIGATLGQVGKAVWSPIPATLGMAASIMLVERILPAEVAPLLHLAWMVAVGFATYVLLTLIFARGVVADIMALIRRPA